MASTRDMPSFNAQDRSKSGQQLEALGSTLWSALFLSHLSTTLSSSYGRGHSAYYTIVLVALPVLMAGIPGASENRRGAKRALFLHVTYAILPALIVLYSPTLQGRSIAALFIHAPLALALLPKSLSATGSVSAWGLLSAALVSVNTFTVLAPPLRPVGFALRGGPADVFSAFLCALGAIIAGFSTAYLTRFARFEKPRRTDPAREIALIAGLYLNALCEETLYRGLALNLFDEWLPARPAVALTAASVLFALAHLQREKHGFKTPNWRFAATALAYGGFCGVAWRRSGRVAVAAVVHAAFNYALRVMLKKDNIE